MLRMPINKTKLNKDVCAARNIKAYKNKNILKQLVNEKKMSN